MVKTQEELKTLWVENRLTAARQAEQAGELAALRQQVRDLEARLATA